MNKIYEQAKDLGVKGLVFFRNSTTTVLYADSELTKLADPDVVLDAFVKGKMLIADGSDTKTLYTPASCTVDSTNVELTFIAEVSSTLTAVTAVAALTDDSSAAAEFAKITA